MKKFICTTLALVILLAMTAIAMASPTGGAGEIKFTDVPKGAWFEASVNELSSKGIIQGYADGTFRPDNNLTVAELIKVLVTSLGYTDIESPKEFWALGYIDKAKSLELVKDGEYIYDNSVNLYNKPADRREMARMFVRALTVLNEQVPTDYIKYQYNLNDLGTLDDDTKANILKLYAMGIVKGNTDGSFGVKNDLKRSEICELIIRLTNKSRRVDVSAPVVKKQYDYYNDDPIYNGLTTLYPQNAVRSDDGGVIDCAGDRTPVYEKDYDFYFKLNYLRVKSSNQILHM